MPFVQLFKYNYFTFHSNWIYKEIIHLFNQLFLEAVYIDINEFRVPNRSTRDIK